MFNFDQAYSIKLKSFFIQMNSIGTYTIQEILRMRYYYQNPLVPENKLHYFIIIHYLFLRL